MYLCLLVFKGLFFLSVHCSTLSLSDFPPEGSSWRRHPSDSARQEPGPEGRSGKGLHWRRAVFSAAWSLHRLPGVSILIIYGLLLLFHNSAHVGLYLVCLHNLIWIPLPYSFIFDIIYAVKWQGLKKKTTFALWVALWKKCSCCQDFFLKKKPLTDAFQPSAPCESRVESEVYFRFNRERKLSVTSSSHKSVRKSLYCAQ